MKTKTFFLLCIISMVGTLSTFAATATPEAYTRIEQEPTPTVIEILENGEHYSIEITSIGCFNGTRQTVRISKNKDIYTATFQDETKVLSEENINAFINFEVQLKSLQMGGCTTVDTYVIRYGGQEFRTSDGTCSWNGGRKLLQLFS